MARLAGARSQEGRLPVLAQGYHCSATDASWWQSHHESCLTRVCRCCRSPHAMLCSALPLHGAVRPCRATHIYRATLVTLVIQVWALVIWGLCASGFSMYVCARKVQDMCVCGVRLFHTVVQCTAFATPHECIGLLAGSRARADATSNIFCGCNRRLSTALRCEGLSLCFTPVFGQLVHVTTDRRG